MLCNIYIYIRLYLSKSVHLYTQIKAGIPSSLEHSGVCNLRCKFTDSKKWKMSEDDRTNGIQSVHPKNIMPVEPSTLEGSAGHLGAFPSVNLLNGGNHDYHDYLYDM